MRMPLRIGAVAAAMLASASNAQPLCDRACLTEFVDSYFDALATNESRSVPISADARITSNGRVMGLAETFWDTAERTIYRWDIVNERRGDTGSKAVVQNEDGSKTVVMLRLKVLGGEITEIETIKANEGDADSLWDPDRLIEATPALRMSIREAEQDSYYGLIAAAEGYWRAFQTTGTEAYRPARLLPDTVRFENGLQTTGLRPNGEYNSAARGFDQGVVAGRNIWDRRYPVVDTERGIVLSIVRFGLQNDAESQFNTPPNDRLVGEFFAVKAGMIREIHAVLFNLPDSESTGWTADYGPDRGGW